MNTSLYIELSGNYRNSSVRIITFVQYASLSLIFPEGDKMRYRVGVDVGGTFTDLIAIDENGAIKISKTPSTPKDASLGIVHSIIKAKVDLKDVTFFSHGSTVGANTIIENKGVKTAIITSKGFRDNLELRRGQRVINNSTDMYNLQMDLPQCYVGGYNPLVPRKYRYEVSERLNYKGEEVKPLDEGMIRSVARDARIKGIKAIAVCYLYSFINPNHERRTAEILRDMLPDTAISISSEILPVIREYERLSTTVLNAYIMPIMQGYIERLGNKLTKYGFDRDYYIMQSSGGIMSSKVASQRPVYTIDSGPAGGVSAAAKLGNVLGYPNVIAFDMGGTTTKICVIRDGHPSITTRSWADGKYFNGAPMMNMVEIGSGGGSICWLDAANSIHIGPQSAGARPGPACYKMGGNKPTITDAIMTLGYINPGYFLGGNMKVDINASREIIQKKIGDNLRMSLVDAASGIYRLATANMVGAMRVVTVQRGYDPRDFSMIVFGGTGPLFAVSLARELHVPRVIIPLVPGCFSAFGLVTADARYDLFRSYVCRTTKASPEKMQTLLDEMKREGIKKIEELGFRESDILLYCGIEMRYEGQAHEVNIELPRDITSNKLTEESLKKIETIFREKHHRLYSYSSPDAPCEFCTLSVSATGPLSKINIPLIKKGTSDSSQAFKANRTVFWGEYNDYIDTPTYDRSRLKATNVIIGPAIIEQMDTTIAIPPEQKARVDKYGNIIINVKI